MEHMNSGVIRYWNEVNFKKRTEGKEYRRDKDTNLNGMFERKAFFLSLSGRMEELRMNLFKCEQNSMKRNQIINSAIFLCLYLLFC